MAGGIQIAGPASMKVGSRQWLIIKATLTPSGEEVEAVLHTQGVAGFKTKAAAPTISGELVLRPNDDPRVFDAYRDELVEVDAGNGRTYVIRHAFRTKRIEHDLTEGQTPFELQGTEGDWK